MLAYLHSTHSGYDGYNGSANRTLLSRLSLTMSQLPLTYLFSGDQNERIERPAYPGDQ
jgi:hypothetical protein